MDLPDAQKDKLRSELQRAGVELPASHRFDCFGDTQELSIELGSLVASGKKRATAGHRAAYDYEGEPLPVPGEIEVICDLAGNLLAVIETTDVRVMPFLEVGEEHAKLEGEGDGSLEHWRRVHREYYRAECDAMGCEFSEQDLIVCQRFRLLYPPDTVPSGDRSV